MLVLFFLLLPPGVAAFAPISPRQPHSAAPHLRAGTLLACDEVKRANRRRDEQALRSEMDVAGESSAVDSGLDTLREYIKVVETKESQLGEIKSMLVDLGGRVGVPLVEGGEVLPAAWVFVGLNVVLAAYAAYALVLEPAARSAGLTG